MPPRHKLAVVYVIGSEEFWPVKIGMAYLDRSLSLARPIERRCRDLQIGCPFELDIRAWSGPYDAPPAFGLEYALHNHLYRYDVRVNGSTSRTKMPYQLSRARCSASSIGPRLTSLHPPRNSLLCSSDRQPFSRLIREKHADQLLE